MSTLCNIKKQEGVMKITKLGHSCLLVEMPDRTALFDPGVWSEVDLDSLKWLDDIFITHKHNDHMDIAVIQALQSKFPDVRIVAPEDALDDLKQGGVQDVRSDAPEGVRFFEAPHEALRPLSDVDPPQQKALHYLDTLTDPGDSHSFSETMPILALPVQAPWGSTVGATQVALDLKPKYVLPIHDWHWNDEARQWAYQMLEARLKQAGITFIPLEYGKPVVLDV
jgi:L-ascorbate metabolism protein UlaG (beta-lactamase superfamily)